MGNWGSKSYRNCIGSMWGFAHIWIQVFREKLSEKVHATIAKGIVGGFEYTVLQRNLKEWHKSPWNVCLRVLKESNKSRFDSYSVRNSILIISPYYLSGLSCAHFFRQPLSKKLNRADF